MIFELLKRKNQSGYIALISIIIIAVLLIAVSVVVSFGGFFTRFSILENEYKEISIGLAEACGDVAITKLAEDWSYPGDEIVSIVSNNCQIFPIQSPSSEERIIRTQAIYQKSYTNLEIKISKSEVSGLPTINIESWQELAKF